MIQKLLEVLIIYSLSCAVVAAGELTFEKKIQEVTTKPDVEVVYIGFNFENKSDEVVKIVSYVAPCSCMEARLKRPDKKNSLVFEPGDKGLLIGVLEFGTFSGTIDKVIKIQTDKDAVGEPSITLTCRVTIPKLIAGDKETLVWEVGEDLEPREFSIKVADESVTPINIVSHKHGFGTSDVFDYKMETVKEGREYKVKVTPKKTDDPAMGVLKFYTDSKIPRYKMVQVFLLVDHPKKTTK